jgi:hypothetical protein
MDIEPIPKEFNNEGMTLKLVKREKNIAMYEVHNCSDLIVGYEVHQLRLQIGGEGIIGGQKVTFKTKERLGCNEDFGRYALSLGCLSRAEETFKSWVNKSQWKRWPELPLQNA